MEFKVNIGDITEALTQASMTKDKLTHTWMGNLYLRASKKENGRGYLYLYSTNLNTESLVKIPADVKGEGELLFDPDRMLGGLTGRPREDDVNITTIGGEKNPAMVVKYKRSTFKISLPIGVKDIAKYIQKMPLTEKGKFSVKGSDLAEFCSRGMFCIPTNDNGQAGVILGGMYLTDDEGGYSAYVSDGIIAAQIKIKSEQGKLGQFMIPVSSLPAINRLLGRRREENIAIIPGAGDNLLYFKSGDIIVGIRLLVGSLANLKQIVNQVKPKFHFEIVRADLKSALERASTFTDGKSRAIRLEIGTEAMEIKIDNKISENHDHIDIEHRGEFPEPIRLAVNMDYLANIASGSKSSKLDIGISGPFEALVIADNGEVVDSKYVLMPVRI